MKKHIVSIICLILVATIVVACTGDTSSTVSGNDSSAVSETSGVIVELSDVSSTVESEVSSTVESEVSSAAPVSSTVTPVSSVTSSEPEEDELDPNLKVEMAIEDRDDGPAPSTKVVNGKTYSLTFEDTFKGDELDSSKWVLSPEQERQNMGGYWDDSMTEVRDGALVLWAEMDETPISGSVETRGKWSQAKGYFEARIKMPKPPMCYWGAFWMMCGSMSSLYGGKDGIEIDIMETIPNRSWQVQHNLHWDGYKEDHKSIGAIYTGAAQGVYNGDWHTYAVEWTDTFYKFYIDDQCTATIDENHNDWDILQGTCDAAGYMWLSIEFGKSTGYDSVQENQLPGYMLVDWVRAYK